MSTEAEVVAEYCGFKFRPGDVVMHISASQEYSPELPPKLFDERMRPITRSPTPLVIMECNLQICEGGIQRNYTVRCGLEPSKLLKELELVPYVRLQSDG